jgi:hypothetical protein
MTNRQLLLVHRKSNRIYHNSRRSYLNDQTILQVEKLVVHNHRILKLNLRLVSQQIQKHKFYIHKDPIRYIQHMAIHKS